MALNTTEFAIDRCLLCVCLCAGGWSKSAQQHSLPDPLGKARSAIVRREASPYRSPRHVSPGRHQAGATLIQLDIAGLPAELRGVSVKELVKALGQSVSPAC